MVVTAHKCTGVGTNLSAKLPQLSSKRVLLQWEREVPHRRQIAKLPKQTSSRTAFHNPNHTTTTVKVQASFPQRLCSQLRSPLHPKEAGHKRAIKACALASSEGSSTAPEENEGRSLTFAQLSNALTTAFPVWVALSCGLALHRPSLFTWIQGQLTIWALGLTMLGMGTTLSLSDFQSALSVPKSFLAGVALQYTVMPSLGYLIAHTLGLPHHYAVGIILVACCPGGTASNIVTFLAKGDVALSVLMTAASTFLAVLMTPLLTAWLAGTLVAVDAWGLFSSTLQVVLLPVLLGAALNHSFPRATAAIGQIAPLFAVFTVAAVCGSAIGANAAAIWASGASLALAVFLLHSGGFFFGYTLAKFLGMEESAARTISIEVGMQNSVLGVVLATQNFPNPLTAAPCAISSVCHSLIASILAGIWRITDRWDRAKTEATMNPNP